MSSIIIFKKGAKEDKIKGLKRCIKDLENCGNGCLNINCSCCQQLFPRILNTVFCPFNQ